jgi:hypothetical protein
VQPGVPRSCARKNIDRVLGRKGEQDKRALTPLTPTIWRASAITSQSLVPNFKARARVEKLDQHLAATPTSETSGG